MPKAVPPKLLPICVAACVAIVFVAATPARAQAPDEAGRARAKALLQEGARQMEERQYDKAVESFDEAYRLVPSPKILFNRGIAYLSVARHADALEAFEGFLKEATDAPAASQQTARRHIDELRGKVATLGITSDRPRADLVLDGRARGEVTFDHDLTIDAGPHDLRARAGDATVEERFTAPAGQRVAVTLTFTPAPAPAVNLAAPPPAGTDAAIALTVPAAKAGARPLTQRPWFWVATGAAVFVVATVIVVLATSGTKYPTADQTVTGP